MDFAPRRASVPPASAPHYPNSEPPPAISSDSQEKATLASNREWTTTPARPRLLLLLPAVAVIIVTLGFVAVILGLLLVFQCVEAQGGRGILPAIKNGYFYTKERNEPPDGSKTRLWVLFVSNLASQFVAGSSSFIMALVAYRVGAEWLRISRSQSTSSTAETPSPAQYGLLVRLLGSSSVSAIADASVYTARSRNRTPIPRIFRYSLLLAAAIWVFARLVGATDSWLHGTSSSSPAYIKVAEPQPAPTRMWGVSFNNSICADMRAKYHDTSQAVLPYDCLKEHEDFINNENWGHTIAFQAMTNSTEALFHVGVVNGNTAFVFPGPKYVDMETKNFIIPTFATQASCISINNLCAKDATDDIVNCTSAGVSQFPYYREDNQTQHVGWVTNRVVGLIDGDAVGLQQGTLGSMNTPRNPAPLAVQLQWEDLEQGGAAAVQATGGDLAINENPRPTLYSRCNLTFFDAFVQWDSLEQGWTLLNTTAISDERTATLWLPLVWQYATEELAASLMYTARMDSKEVVMRELGENLARLTLVSAAGFFTPSNASGVTQTERILVSEYQVLPIAALLLLLLAYALLASRILLSAYQATDEAIIVPGADGGSFDEGMQPSTLTLAQRWLTNPLPLVGHSFAGGDGQDRTRSAARSAVDTAYDGGEGHARLTIGLVGDRFGVTPWGQR